MRFTIGRHVWADFENISYHWPAIEVRRYAIEVRHPSWFQDLSYSFFANNDICLIWSALAELQTPPIVTTDFVYVRLIGDRRPNGSVVEYK